MATIADIVQNNQWHSSDIRESTDVNALFSGGTVSDGGDMAQAAVNALDFDNVQSVIKTGLEGYAWSEQNLGDASDTEVDGADMTMNTVNIKTFYGNQWWTTRNIQKDLMNSSRPISVVNEFVGRFWATQVNRIISGTLSGMSAIPGIALGSGANDFSAQMVDDSRLQKGDMGYGKLSKMYMHSITVADIMRKQKAAGAPDLISQKYGTVTIVKDGITQLVQSQTPELVYGGVTPIIVDDTMEPGTIALVDDGAFAYTLKNLDNAMMYDSSPRAGRGVGKELWGTKSIYIVHPKGFSFKEAQTGSNAYSKSGLTVANLKRGDKYELAVPAKLSPIHILKVKIG